MAPENHAILRHKIPLHRRLPCGPLDKARVILIRHKADLLAVRLVRHPKLQTGREFPDLFLCIGPHRHQRVGKLFLGQIVKGVGLVLGLRHAAAHGEAAVCQPGHPGVVPCGDIVRANLQAALKKRLPFHIAVAGDAGVRRAPCQIFRRKIVNDRFFEIRLKIHHIIGNAQLRRHPSGVVHGGKAAAASVLLLLLLCLILPDLHGHPDDLIALLQKEPGRHRRIHAAGHPDYHLFSAHIPSAISVFSRSFLRLSGKPRDQYSSSSSSSPSWMSDLGF